jgi:hypothetical protein
MIHWKLLESKAAGGFLFKGCVLGVLAVTRSLGDHMLKDMSLRIRPSMNAHWVEWAHQQ